MDENSGFGEQAINKIAAVAISRQVKQADSIEVQIKTDLNKLAQGHIDSVSITLYGILLASQVEAEILRLQIGQVTVKPFSALRGKIKLVHPSAGTLHLVINQEELTVALNPDALLERLRSQQRFDPNATITARLANGTITIVVGIVESPSNNIDTPLLVFVATPEISPDGKVILLQQARYLEGQEPSPEFTQTLVTHIEELLSLSDFEQKGMQLHIQQLDVSAGKLALNASARIEQFPSS